MGIIVLIIIIAFVIYKCYVKFGKSDSKTPSTQQTATSNTTESKYDYSNVYQRKLLFTKNEYYELKKLEDYTNKHNLKVFAKVRLLDLVEPIRGKANYQTLLYKIQAKHVDFVILDHNYHVKGIIEIDDNSHNRDERKERDNFVDLVLTQTGYKILRTRSLTEELLNQFLKP